MPIIYELNYYNNHLCINDFPISGHIFDVHLPKRIHKILDSDF